VISDYLDSLVGALSFDRPLSGRVRQEVEDHLREAVAADPAGDGPEAERRAIADFGDPRVIAAEFAMVSLAKQTRRVGAAIILVIAGVFIAMKARVAWYAVTQCAISDDIRAVCGIVGSIDAILAFGRHRDRGLAVYQRPPYSRGVLYGVSQAASSFPFPLHSGDGCTHRIGDQRWPADSASVAWNAAVRRILTTRLLDGDRSRMRWSPRFPNSQHHAASDVHSGLVENLKSTRRCTTAVNIANFFSGSVGR
jgi:hypothetical protein